MTGTDPRVVCTACRHRVSGWCLRAQLAGLSKHARTEVGNDLAKTPQHCQGFEQRGVAPKRFAHAFAPESQPA